MIDPDGHNGAVVGDGPCYDFISIIGDKGNGPYSAPCGSTDAAKPGWGVDTLNVLEAKQGQNPQQLPKCVDLECRRQTQTVTVTASSCSDDPLCQLSLEQLRNRGLGTIGPDPDWFHSKQYSCIGQGVIAAGKDAIGYDVFKAVADSVADGSVKPLKALFTGSTAISAAGRGADYIAGNRPAQLAIKGVARSEGFAASANAVGRVASLSGKALKVLGAGLAINTGHGAYAACRQD